MHHLGIGSGRNRQAILYRFGWHWCLWMPNRNHHELDHQGLQLPKRNVMEHGYERLRLINLTIDERIIIEALIAYKKDMFFIEYRIIH